MRKIHGLIVLALIALLLAALVALDDTTGFGLVQRAGCASACKCVRGVTRAAFTGWPSSPGLYALAPVALELRGKR